MYVDPNNERIELCVIATEMIRVSVDSYFSGLSIDEDKCSFAANTNNRHIIIGSESKLSVAVEQLEYSNHLIKGYDMQPI